MAIILSAFKWLVGQHDTGVGGNTDKLVDDYRSILGGLDLPTTYTTANVAQLVSRAAKVKAQADLAKTYHEAHRGMIKDLDALDHLTTDSAKLYSDIAVKIGARRAEAQGKILANASQQTVINAEVNALKIAYAEGLNLRGA